MRGSLCGLVGFGGCVWDKCFCEELIIEWEDNLKIRFLGGVSENVLLD